MGIFIELLNEVDTLREKIQMVVLMGYFPVKPDQAKPYGTVCFLKENYTDYSIFGQHF